MQNIFDKEKEATEKGPTFVKFKANKIINKLRKKQKYRSMKDHEQTEKIIQEATGKGASETVFLDHQNSHHSLAESEKVSNSIKSVFEQGLA